MHDITATRLAKDDSKRLDSKDNTEEEGINLTRQTVSLTPWTHDIGSPLEESTACTLDTRLKRGSWGNNATGLNN